MIDKPMQASILAFLCVYGAVFGLPFAGYHFVYLPWKCAARWDGVYATEYGPIKGCRVQVDGRFIPEDRLRQLEEKNK